MRRMDRDIWKKDFGFSGNTVDSVIGHYEKIESILDVSYHRSDNHNKDSDKIANGCDALGWKLSLIHILTLPTNREV